MLMSIPEVQDKMDGKASAGRTHAAAVYTHLLGHPSLHPLARAPHTNHSNLFSWLQTKVMEGGSTKCTCVLEKNEVQMTLVVLAVDQGGLSRFTSRRFPHRGKEAQKLSHTFSLCSLCTHDH